MSGTAATRDAGFFADALRSTARKLFGGDDRFVPLGALLELGWAELAAADLATAVGVLADEQGRRLGISRLVELAMVAAAPKPTDLADVAFVFAVAPGAGTAFGGGQAAAKGGGAPIDGVVLVGGAAARAFAVPVLDGEAVSVRCVGATEAEVTPVAGIDPAAGVARVRVRTGAHGDTLLDDAAWEAAAAVGSLAVAHELLGVTAAMLDLAVVHVRGRHQFGVPIGSFQAVQHRLADVLVALEAGRAVSRTAWRDRDPCTAAAARWAAGRAFETAARHCHQVTGAMGSTWEHDLHRYQRRGLLLEQLFDPTPMLRRALATVVPAQRRVEVLEG